MSELTATDLEDAIRHIGINRYSEDEWNMIYNTARRMKEEVRK